MESKYPAHQDDGRRLQQAPKRLHLLHEGWQGHPLVDLREEQPCGFRSEVRLSEVREASLFDCFAIHRQ